MGDKLNIAIAHDYLNQMGGAEKCVLVMHDIFPDAPIYTSLFEPDLVSPRFSEMDVRPSFMQKLPFMKKHFRYALALYPYAFETFDMEPYEVVLSSSSAFAKGVITGPGTCHICYCYTPMRFAWNYHYFIKREHAGGMARRVLPAIMTPMRVWDQASAQRVDYFIAISNVVAERIRKFYRRESEIIYPPADTARLVPAKDGVGDYFLVVSRLIPYKRIDIAVEAFNQTGLPLKIIGDGREGDRLRAMAKKNIEFLGWVGDEEVRHHFAHCKAFIFTGEEDFGITPVEAQACGRPVIAYGAGGALETIIDGETGMLFPRQTPECLAEALERFDDRKYDPDRIRQHALQFDVEIFKRKLERFVREKNDEYHAARRRRLVVPRAG